MGTITVADKQRTSYKELLNKVIPQFLQDSSYVKDNRYQVSFRLYPIDSINTIEDGGFVYTILKTFCKIEDLETGEYQELVIDLLKIPVYQELGFMIAGNYKQVLDLYDKPAGWSFFKETRYHNEEPYDFNEAKLLSANYKTISFANDKQAPYFKCSKTAKNKSNSKEDKDKIPIAVLFRALTGYTLEELLELFGYDNHFNTLTFSDNQFMSIDNSKNTLRTITRTDCINILYNTLFSSVDAAGKGIEEKLNRIKNWFFKKSYMNLGPGNKKRFDYIQSFRNRALNQLLAEDVKLADTTLKAGTILTANILTQIDNSPVTCIKVEVNKKIHSLHKYSVFTFRALGYYLAENIDLDNYHFKAGQKLTLDDLKILNESSLDSIAVTAKSGANQKKIIMTRNADGTVLTIEDMFTAYSIFANNMNGYNYISDIDELTDKIVVPFDQKVLSLISTNVNNFINRLNDRLDIIKHGQANNKIIDALTDFSDVLNKNSLLEAVSNVDNTEAQLSDVNNVISFIAKDFKVTNQGSGNTTTDSLIGVHGLQFGRLDPYDSPESGKIGKVHHRTMLAKEDSNGYLLTPYVVVQDGVVTDKVEYLSATDEKDLYIAEWNETFINEDGSPKARVKVRYKGEILTVDTTEVHYKEYSPLQNLSPTTSCIPFPNFAAGKRIQMSCNQQKQAVSTMKTERPLVCTGAESLLGTGVYKANEILQQYYDEQVYECPELEAHKDTILQSDLQLLRIMTTGELRKLTLLVVEAEKLDIPGLNTEAYLEVPFAQHTLKSDMFSYNINASTGGYFKCNDIVAYNTSYDKKEYKLTGVMDYGALNVTQDQLQGSVALGHNYRVAFKTMESSSIDDGIVISSALVADDTITSIMIHKESVELLNSSTKTEIFEAPRAFTNGPAIENFNLDGLPKRGVYLYPGDPVVYKKITEQGPQKKRNSQSFSPKCLGKYTEGQVIRAEIVKKPNGTFAEVYLACRVSGEVADKFAGRIGNKGVVAKIIPEEMMPYDPVSGESIEMILNPLGVPSRMNITQLLEVTVAAAASKNGEIAVVSPFHPNSLNFVLESAEKAGIKPIKLIDGRTGKPFEREINVGYQYMYKLVHMAKKNIHAVGLQHGVNQVTLQAKSSAKLNGGQSFGEMESWCLESIGAMKVLQELQTTLSDDRTARNQLEKQLVEDPYEVSIKGENHNDIMMTTLLRLLGTNITTKVDETSNKYYEFSPLKDSTIRSFSTTSVSKDSLHSSSIFGTNNSINDKMVDRKKWGWIDLHTEIVHPTWIEKGSLSKLFMVREASTNTIPTTESEIKWSRTDSLAKNSLLAKIKDCEIFVRCVDNDDHGKLHIIKDVIYRNLDEKSKQLYLTGFAAISYIFRNYDMEKSLINLEMRIMDRNSEDSQRNLTLTELKAISRNKSLEEARHCNYENFLNSLRIDAEDPSSVYEFCENNASKCILMDRYVMVKDFIDSGSSLEDYLITSYPVMPAIYRVSMETLGRPTKNDFDVHYEAILNAVEYAKSNDSQSAKLAIYKAICNFIGITTGAQKAGKKAYTTVLEWFVGKSQKSSSAKNHGKIRETVQKKIIGRSGRSVIIPADDPTRSPIYIGLPFSMAVVMYEEQLIPHLMKYVVKNSDNIKLKVKDFRELFLAIASNNSVRFNELYESKFKAYYALPNIRARFQFIEWIKLFVEGTDGAPIGPNNTILEPQVVIAGRQPSLHRYSIRAYYPKIVFTKAIQVHSLVCSGYNADFDGDQMWIAALLSKEAMDEAMALMSAKSDIINPKNGDIILTHAQDIALGLYCMTMLKDNALELDDCNIKYYYSSIDLLKTDILNGEIHSYDVIAFTRDDKHFVSTAGRIMFNALLPDGFAAETGTFTNKLNINVQKPERYAELKYDGLITTGKSADGRTSYKLSNICKELYNEVLEGSYQLDDMLDVFQSFTEMGFKMSDRHSVSISIFDLRAIADKSNKKSILADAEALQKVVERDYQKGLLSDTDKASCIQKLYKKAFDSIEEDIFGNVKKGITGALERNNNIFIMFDSGARGSKSQIMQSIGVVGNLQKTKDTDLEMPVIANYSEGLSNFDFQMLAYSTRTGMASTQNETKNSGYASRRAEHCSSGLEIAELDCGKTDWWYDVTWGKRIDELSTLAPTKKWFENNLLGETVDVNDSQTMELFGDSLDNGVITSDAYEKVRDGFHSIKLVNKLIEITPEMLIGTKTLDEESSRYLKYYKQSGFLTREALNIVNKRHMRSIETDIGTFQFRYSLSELSRSLLENREARDMPGLKKYTGPLSRRLRSDMYIISDETLDWIEKTGTERIPARILLDCKSGRDDNGLSNKTLHSCCARCYGLKYTSNTLPKVGENIGIEAAQAVGEPAAQLTLSLVNKGGATGESVASGVDILHKLLDGSNIYTDKTKVTPLVSKVSGYLDIEILDKKVKVNLLAEDGNILRASEFLSKTKVSKRINAKSLICKDKEWINAGEPITAGYVLPENVVKIPENDLKHLIRAKQIVWLTNWFNTFFNSNIIINARHFELFTKAQASDMTVRYSDNPAYKVGKRYKVSDILEADGTVLGTLSINNCKDTILNSSGALAVLSYEDIMGSLPLLAQQHYRSYKNSPTGALNLGEDLVNKSKKELVVFEDYMIHSDEDTQAQSEDIIFTEVQESNMDLANIDLLGSMGDINLMDMTLDFDEPAVEADEDLDNLLESVDAKEETETIVEVSEPQITGFNPIESKDMDLFSNSYAEEQTPQKFELSYALLQEGSYEPVEGIDVALLKDKQVILNTTSDDSGNIVFTDIEAGNYNVKILSDKIVGDKDKYVRIDGSKPLVDGGIWELQMQADDSYYGYNDDDESDDNPDDEYYDDYNLEETLDEDDDKNYDKFMSDYNRTTKSMNIF